MKILKMMDYEIMKLSLIIVIIFWKIKIKNKRAKTINNFYGIINL